MGDKAKQTLFQRSLKFFRDEFGHEPSDSQKRTIHHYASQNPEAEVHEVVAPLQFGVQRPGGGWSTEVAAQKRQPLGAKGQKSLEESLADTGKIPIDLKVTAPKGAAKAAGLGLAAGTAATTATDLGDPEAEAPAPPTQETLKTADEAPAPAAPSTPKLPPPPKAPALSSVEIFREDPPAPEDFPAEVTIKDPKTGEEISYDAEALITSSLVSKAEEIERLQAEYKQSRDRSRSAALWAEIIRGVAALAMVQYGLKHGVDMSSGLKFDPIDWVARQEADRRGYDSEIMTASKKYDALVDAGKNAQRASAEEWRAALNQWNAKAAKNSQLMAATDRENNRQLRRYDDQYREYIDALRLEDQRKKVEQAKTQAAAKGLEDRLADMEKVEDKFQRTLSEMAQAEAQGKDTLARTKSLTLKGLSDRYRGLSGVPLVDDDAWESPRMFGLFGTRQATSEELAESRERARQTVTVRLKSTGEIRRVDLPTYEKLKDDPRIERVQ